MFNVVMTLLQFNTARSALRGLALAVALTGLAVVPAGAASAKSAAKPSKAPPSLEAMFDRTFTGAKNPAKTQAKPAEKPATASVSLPTLAQPAALPKIYANALEARIAALADADAGRIGVAAFDLSTGRSLEILGTQPFPMASTSKIAVAATFLEGVDQGRFNLFALYPRMVPLPSRKLEGDSAPVREGELEPALSLIEAMIIRSDNQATDALLAAVGGPQAVNAWMRRAGISDARIDRSIATLVRDDGLVDPAKTIDVRDSATPRAMVRLLAGLHRGQWLSPSSRAVLIGAMERCVTGKRRIPGQMPEGVRIAHKTGTLSNTTSDVGIVELPDGRAVAMAIYVTGQGGRQNRETRIATIARAIYDGYVAEPANSYRATAAR